MLSYYKGPGAPPTIHRCIRAALAAAAVLCAVLIFFAVAGWHHITDSNANLGNEAMLAVAAVVSKYAFVIGAVWLGAFGWYRRSVGTHVALWGCLAMSVLLNF